MRHLYRLKSTVSLFLFTIISHLCLAQISPVTGERILPMSPDAKSFSKYGEYPVDHSTGVPQIQIPIYQVRSGSLTLPISLDYHASGIKVEEISSSIGLGWTLKAGGMIARSIRGGIADEVGGGFLKETVPTSSQIDNATWETMGSHLYWMETGQIDTQSDTYTYSVGDKLSGSFVYNFTKELKHLSYSENIVKHKPASNTYEIIADDGTRYYFDQKEISIDYDQNIPYPSTWLITKIISFDNADTISFEYSKHSDKFTQQLLSQSMAYAKVVCAGSINPRFEEVQSTRSAVHSDIINLSRIKFKNGYIKFEYLGDRKDFRYLRLTDIKIYNSKDRCLQQYKLNQSYFESYTRYVKNEFHYRLKLDEIKNLSGDGQYLNSYRFEYNKELLPPYFDPTKPYPTECFGVDYWGYYNGHNDNESYIYGIPDELRPANRNPDVKFTKACILERIDYPTGGYSVFNYEENKDDSNYIVGGLRVASILSRASASAPYFIKRYEYKEGIHVRPDDFFESYLISDLKVYQGYIVDGPVAYCNWCLAIGDIYYGTPLNPLGNHNGSYMVYGLVNEYTEGEGESKKMLVSYRYMTEQDGGQDVDFPKFKDFYTIDRSWLRGKLIEQNFYNWTDNKYELVKSKEYQFKRMNEEQIYTGIQFSKRWMVTGCAATNSHTFTIQETYSYFDVRFETGILKLESEKTKNFLNGRIVEDVTLYDYNGNGHLYPTKLSKTNSDGKAEITTIKYASDISLTGDAENARIKLLESNFRIAKLEEIIEKDGIALLRTITDYSLFNGNPYPRYVKLYRGNTVTPEVTTYSYDKGNVVEIRKNNDLPVSFIWGYNGSYPIAELRNVKYVDIQNILGISTLGELYKRETTDPLVKESTQILRNSTNLKNHLVNTYTYEPLVGLLSLADHNNQVTRYEYDNFQRLVTKYDHNDNVVQQFNYSYKPYQKIFVNEVYALSFTRNNCGEGFRGTSVDYTAIKGLFASTISVADATQKARNYLKATGQQYANLHGACLSIPSYFNVELNKPFQRNNCDSGVGSVINYIVPAAKYISYISQVDADNKAINEANLNGQALANTQGICSTIYYNAARSAYFSRKCPASYATYPVQYTVPLGKYTSSLSQQDADQKAINDINEKGQAYADSNGECYVNIDYSDWTLYINEGNCTLIRPAEDSIIPVEIDFPTPGRGYPCTIYIPQGVTQYEFRLSDCPSFGASFVTISHVEYLN